MESVGRQIEKKWVTFFSHSRNLESAGQQKKKKQKQKQNAILHTGAYTGVGRHTHSPY